MRTEGERLAEYNILISRGLSDYESREAAFGNEWDTAEDVAYRESLYGGDELPAVKT